jgi:hypothetical protein
MAGLVPAIYDLPERHQDVDARDKPSMTTVISYNCVL